MLSGIRQKPDICGTDFVSVTGVGFFSPFGGTSAAAPHVAAIAALVWQKHPTYSAAQVKTRITNSAEDLGALGYDNVYGYGLIDAYSAALDLCAVTFDPNDGTEGDTYALPINGIIPDLINPSRVGYTFRGWYRDQACTVPWNFPTDILVADMTLYAKWSKDICTITFSSFSDNTYNPVTIPYDTYATDPGAPTRDGFIFGGWCSDEECIDLWNFDTDPVEDDMTLYAMWIPVVLPAPETITPVSRNYTSIIVNWSQVRWADGYEVWCATSSGGSFQLVATTTSPTATVNGLKMTAPYYFKVRAFRNDTPIVYGDFSVVASARPLPAAPPSFKAVPSAYNIIKVSWSKVTEAARYELYRATSSNGAYKLLTTTTALNYTNTGIATGVTYFYKSRSCWVSGSKIVYGNFSPIVSATATPAVPTTVKAARVSSTSTKVSWAKAAGATKYEVWRCMTSATGTYTLVTTTTALNFTNIGLTTGKTCWYKVRALVTVGSKKVYSAYSSVVSAKP